MKEHVSDLLGNVFTLRQKAVFNEVCAVSNRCTASFFVKFVSEKYGFSHTSVWHTVRKFRKMGLVDFGNSSEVKMLMLTDFGKMVKGGDKNAKTYELSRKDGL